MPCALVGEMAYRMRRRTASNVQGRMIRHWTITFATFAAINLAGCAGSGLPSPNSAQAEFESRDQSIRIMVSETQPTTAAALIAPDGTRIPASAITPLSGPHVEYSAPPSLGLGIGGFGFGGCCSGFGSGIGLGLPLGGPTATRVDDQFVTAAVIPAPPDYPARWQAYRVEVVVGNRPLLLAAPPPAAG